MVGLVRCTVLYHPPLKPHILQPLGDHGGGTHPPHNHHLEPNLPKLLLTPAEVMALTGLGRGFVYSALESGWLPCVSPTPKGVTKHVRRADLDAWLASLPLAVQPPTAQPSR